MIKNKKEYVKRMTEGDCEIIVNEILEIFERENICVGFCNAILRQAEMAIAENSFVRIKTSNEVEE